MSLDSSFHFTSIPVSYLRSTVITRGDKHRIAGMECYRIDIRPLPSAEAGTPVARQLDIDLMGREVCIESVDLGQDLMIMSVHSGNNV